MKVIKLKTIKVLMFLAFLFLSFSGSNLVWANPISRLLEEARTKKAQGDLEGAAVLYHKILKMEENKAARKELAEVLIDAQIKEPHSDYSDAALSILKNPEMSR